MNINRVDELIPTSVGKLSQENFSIFYESGANIEALLKEYVLSLRLRGVAQFGLARLNGVQKVVGSSPTSPIF